MAVLTAQLSRLNGLGSAAARTVLMQCCGSPVWAVAVLAERPYLDTVHLLRVAERTLAELDWAEVKAAASAHPRIGEAAPGDEAAARWSKSEQAAAAVGSAKGAALPPRLIEYEAKFGHRFLISARGLSLERIAARLEERICLDSAHEREETRRELSKITVNRLRELMADG